MIPPFYNLPRAQRETMNFIVKNIQEKGESPTLQEIADHFGFRVQNAWGTVKRLKGRGLLTGDKNAERGLTLTAATLELIKPEEKKDNG